MCDKVYMANDPSAFDNLRLELRRGCLALAVLGELGVERYGYTLRQTLEEHGIAIDEGTLYPLLRRLEAQGLLVSEWREEGRRKKRFYQLSVEGRRTLERLATEWHALDESLKRIFEGETDGRSRSLSARG